MNAIANRIRLEIASWEQFASLWPEKLRPGRLMVAMKRPPQAGGVATVRLCLPSGAVFEHPAHVMQVITAAPQRHGVELAFVDWEKRRLELAALAPDAFRMHKRPDLQENVERRSSPRVDFDVQVTLESEHNFYTGFAENLSCGGLFVQTAVLRPIGSRLRVRFGLPERPEPIEAMAEVRWIRDVADPIYCGMGLRLEGLASNARAAIEQFMAQREALFYEED